MVKSANEHCQKMKEVEKRKKPKKYYISQLSSQRMRN